MTSISAHFDRLDEGLDRLEEALQKFDDKSLSTPPKPDGWSAKQLVKHLMISDDLAVKATLAYHSKQRPTPRGGLPSILRSRILQFFLWSKIKVRSPQPVRVDDPSHNLESIDQMFAQWREKRKHHRKLLESLPHSDLGKLYFKHPIIGLLTVSQMLLFLIRHQHRHTFQAVRAARSHKNDVTNGN